MEQPTFAGDGSAAFGYILQHCAAFPFRRRRGGYPRVRVARYVRCHPLLDHELASLITCVVRDLEPSVLIPSENAVRLLDENLVPLNQPPLAPVLRLMKREHAEEFFDTGTLRLGSLSAYRAYEHVAIGDHAEGSFVLAAESMVETTIVKAVSGYNHHLLCCTLAPVSRQLAESFGADAGFEIVNVRAFAETVAEVLDARHADTGLCQYHEGKSLWSRLERESEESPPVVIDRLARKSKYFVKSPFYAPQREFRFLWEVDEEVDGFRFIDVPKARKYCRFFRL
jgi:hypothetical protein